MQRNGEASILRLGIAVEEIIPKLPARLYGYPGSERTAEKAHDPLLVSAIHLRNGSSQMILVSLDLMYLDPPTVLNIRSKVSEQVGVREEYVFVSCTHTHSGPATVNRICWQDNATVPEPDPEYIAAIKEAVLAAAAKATAFTHPAEMAWTTASSKDIGGNRFAVDGPTDPEIGLLVFRKMDTHAVSAVTMITGVPPSVLNGDCTEVSADYPFYVRQSLQKHFGESLVMIHQTAPCGDQGLDWSISERAFKGAEYVGSEMGRRVIAAIEGLKDEDFSNDPFLAAVSQVVELPERKMPTTWNAKVHWGECRAELRRLEEENAPAQRIKTAKRSIVEAEGTMGLIRAHARGNVQQVFSSYRMAEVQALQIGDVYLLGMPGVLFADYALMVKKDTDRKTFVVNLVNGELQGTILSPDAVAARPNSATNSLFGSKAGRTLVKTGLSIIKALADPEEARKIAARTAAERAHSEKEGQPAEEETAAPEPLPGPARGGDKNGNDLHWVG